MSPPDIVLIDNFDSFTFNLVDEFCRLGCKVAVFRNDIAATEALAIAETKRAVIVISPGPGTPQEAGCCLSLIQAALGRVPLLGICLGHQALVEALGGCVARAEHIVHGKRSEVHHDGRGAFAGLPNPLAVGRYHSLVAQLVPEELEVIAQVDDLVMAVRHRHHPALGLQFHPESILTTHGSRLLANALNDLVSNNVHTREIA